MPSGLDERRGGGRGAQLEPCVARGGSDGEGDAADEEEGGRRAEEGDVEEAEQHLDRDVGHGERGGAGLLQEEVLHVDASAAQRRRAQEDEVVGASVAVLPRDRRRCMRVGRKVVMGVWGQKGDQSSESGGQSG